jgi:type IV pilus assembly protein PilY1
MKRKGFDVSAARGTWIAALRGACYTLAGAAYALVTATAANAQVSQTPLYLGGGDVPGNLLLVPSVEWPTINSAAHVGAYDATRTYLGYFDHLKCYLYSYNATETNRHFYPNSLAVSHACSGALEWSGNFMNWAATQTIDPFRWALTGGYRVKDVTGETWLEKARHDGQGGTLFPDRRLPAAGNNSALVNGATPPSWDFFQMRIQGLGNKMRFTRDGLVNGAGPFVAYDPSVALVPGTVYEVSIRVAVCVGAWLEANCVRYSGGYKPEGLIQQYADDLRLGVFGYLNDPDMMRDGGVLRARQKFVGPTMIVPGVGTAANPNVEWDTTTGVMIQNPDPADSAATAATLGVTIANSGTMNYLNKFGQLTGNAHKNFDPVSELYYAALRYLKNQGNVAEYTNVPGATAVGAARAADGFPVITNWNDPIQYSCQKNVILGIGDVYTHRDKNLPGSTFNTDEPGDPPAVTADATMNVVNATNKVGALEGLGNIGSTNSWSGRNNSAYLAGMAYLANATDIRPEAALPGEQTVSTHWVDVLEAESLEPPAENQYYLATKYGGLKIPDNVTFDPFTFAGPLPLAWWHTNTDTLASFGPRGAPPAISFPRPDNYYLAGSANQMVASLAEAFANIAEEVEKSSASSVAANSTRVDTGTAVFQAAFSNEHWSGDLLAFAIDNDGDINLTPSWSAAAELDALAESDIPTRNILSIRPLTAAGDGSSISTTGIDFTWASLDPTQQAAIQQAATVTVAQDRLAYLRGSRVNEKSAAAPALPFRERASRLGDIVNSDPQFVHHQDFGYTLLEQSTAFSATTAGDDYRAFRQSNAYLNRTELVVVGANDGMLHGFNADLGGSGGQELFAYVPAGAYADLHNLTDPNYQHQYFVDATPRVADAWYGGNWHTIVVGSMGGGGRTVFALDITDPSSVTSSDVLWEFSHPELGLTRAQPAVAPLPNGKFGVIVTSGYETGATDGHIWILDPADGSVEHTIDVPNSGDLGAPLVVDLNGDRVADRIYVGDTDGNLWRFDLVGNVSSNWDAPAALQSSGNPLPLFTAEDASGDPQAITAPLTSAFNEEGQHMVFFGTGSFYRITDNTVPVNPPVDTFYGIIDRGTPIDRGDLLEQEILAEVDISATVSARGVTAHEMTDEDGWYLDLVWKVSRGGTTGPAGERVVSRALVRGDRVVFSTLTPNPDPCDFGGTSWIMELSTWNGGRLSYTVFDTSLDGDFDSDDYITVTDEDGNTIEVPVSGLQDEEIGITATPAIIGISEGDLAGDEIKVLSGSSGALLRIAERGGVGIGRQSWRELR